MLWKSIAASIRSSPVYVFLIVFGASFDLLFRYLSSLSYSFLIDKALIPQDPKALSIIIGALLGIGILNVAAGICGDYAASVLSARLLFNYRLKLFRHMQLQTQRFYERFKTGDLMTRYADDIPAIEAAIVQTFSGALLSVMSVIIGVVILLSMELRLALVVLTGSALLFLPFKLLKSRLQSLNESYYTQLDLFNSSIDENIKAFKVVRVFNLRESMLAKVEGILHSMLSIGVHRGFVGSNLNRLPVLGVSILTAVILAYGSYLTFEGSLTIGEFIAFNSVFVIVGHSMFGIAAVLPTFLAARTSLQRLNQAMEWVPEVDELGVLELPPVRSGIALRDVSFAYVPGEPVLSRLNHDIPVGRYTSIVGPSGSGKSTVLQLLMRFADPDGGAVLYDGHDAREIKFASLLGQMGVVFQDSILLHDTIRDNIRAGMPDAEDAEIEEAARLAGVHEAIAGFRQGYDTVVHNQGENLSGGQRQRIALARALLRDPNLLFLDEATSALDPDTERAVNETIISLKGGRSIISVTHRLSYAAMSDHIIVLDQGEIAESGTHEQLMEQNGLYLRMWEKQQGFVLDKDGVRAHVHAQRLRGLPFFDGIEQEALEQIAGLFVMVSIEAGMPVVEQGDRGDKFYLIARGKVDVYKAAAAGRHKVATLSDGDHFGEIALMYHVPRTATIITATPCLLLSLSYDHFHPLMEKFPSIREVLEATIKLRT
ncbi:MAG: putative multidrug export ATP-binding/permease protein [Paenibacillus sp.]|jgi:ATP-binding cassette subfamily B protein|nr:putative multidrug export ATP-binding/permease protein [Paenibacillus sp.]